eukprot:5281049-Amphidinium_carterae.1
MSLGVSPKGKPLKLALWDRAHLYGDAQRDLYVDLPPEDSRHPNDRRFADLAEGLRRHCAKLLGGKHWKQGDSHGALFYETTTQAIAVVHSNDFLLLGDDDTTTTSEGWTRL